jgi:hypothetical protein
MNSRNTRLVQGCVAVEIWKIDTSIRGNIRPPNFRDEKNLAEDRTSDCKPSITFVLHPTSDLHRRRLIHWTGLKNSHSEVACARQRTRLDLDLQTAQAA